MLKVSWVRKNQDKVKNKDQRSHNSEIENDLLTEVQGWFEIARSGKVDHTGRALNEKFRDMDRVYRGDQWRESVPSYRSTPVLNFTFSLIESEVPRMTDSNPDLLIYPRYDATATLLAEELKRTQEYLWYINDMKEVIEELARMCFKYGTSILKTVWDATMSEGLGDVKYTAVHPINFYPDPRAHKFDDMEFCFTDIPRSLEYFQRMWPEKGHLVVPDSLSTDSEYGMGNSNSVADSMACLKECTFRDEEGNICVLYYAGELVLEIKGGVYDESHAPIYLHNKFPFSRMVNYPLEKEFWGMSEIELVQLLQELVNKFEANIIDNTRLMANAQWVVNKVQSGITEEKAWVLNSRPGAAIFTNNGGVDRLKGESIPPHVTDHLERLIFAMEQILGIHDVVQGRRPSGVRAASAIIALQESANIRIRMKANHLERCLISACQQANSIILENYDMPRRARLSNGTMPITLSIKEALMAHLIQAADQEGMIGEGEGMIPQGATPQSILPEQEDMLMNSLKYPDMDVIVKIGPSVPYSQALLYEQAKEFFGMGLIDRKAVLDMTNFPDKEAITKRMEAAEQAQREAEEQAMRTERVGERY